MFSLPPLPPWNAAHVILVHFPIGLLALAAPVLLLIAVLIPKASRQFAAAAAVLFVLGTGGLWLAKETGGAAYGLAKSQGALDDPEIKATLQKHAGMGVQSRNYYTAFAFAFLLYLLVPLVGKKEVPVGANALILLVFLGASGALALLLANTAHEGGELVHIHGITAPINGSAGASEAAEEAKPEDGAGKPGAAKVPAGADVD